MKGPSPFYSSLLLLVVLNLVIKPVWILGIDRQVQNMVGLPDYGNYFSLLNLSITCNFLLDWGLTSYYNRQLAAGREGYQENAGNFLLVKLLFTGLYVLFVFFIAYIAGVSSFGVLAGVILLQVFTSLFVFLRAVVTAGQLFKTDAWLSILDKSLMILLCSGPLFFPGTFGPMTVGRFIMFQVACMAFAALTTVYLLSKHQVYFRIEKSRFRIFKILTPVWPYALVLLLMSLHYRLDGFLLERMRPDGAYQAGLYASAYRLLDAASMIGYLFATFLLPYIARQSSENKEISSLVLNIRHVLVSFGIGIACTGIFLAPWLNELLYHNHDIATITVLQWCLPAVIGYSLVHIYGTVMTATGHIRAFCVVNAIVVVINIFLNILLIPRLGAKGSCIAALVSQWLCGIIAMLYVRQKLDLPIRVNSLFIYIFIAGIVSAIFYWGAEGYFNKVVLFVTAILATIFILIATRLFKPAVWIQLIGKRQRAT